jgi:transposase
MNLREEIRRRFSEQPPATAESTGNLEAALEEARRAKAQLVEVQKQLEQEQRAKCQLAEALMEVQVQLAEAKAYIAELKRQLFGSKGEPLSAEQEAQLEQLADDAQEQAKSPAPASLEVLAEEEQAKKERRKSKRPSRHPLPSTMETETVTLEPENKHCPRCGLEQHRIGEEVSEEFEYIPAKLIRRRTVRPKYACRCEESTVVIAPMPPRLLPQSKLGLGLAVHLLLTRFDDHLSFYRLEHIFRERHGVEIPRQQMVQWIEHIAGWLKPIYEAMWQEMKAGNYLQIDETPVKVLDRDVSGKTARGYLWFYAVPREDVILEFCSSRGQEAPNQRLQGFQGPSRPTPMKCTKRWSRRIRRSSESGAWRTPEGTSTRRCRNRWEKRSGSSERFVSCTASNMRPVRWITPNAMLCGRCKRLLSGPPCKPAPRNYDRSCCRKAPWARPSTIF